MKYRWNKLLRRGTWTRLECVKRGQPHHRASAGHLNHLTRRFKRPGKRKKGARSQGGGRSGTREPLGGVVGHFATSKDLVHTWGTKGRNEGQQKLAYVLKKNQYPGNSFRRGGMGEPRTYRRGGMEEKHGGMVVSQKKNGGRAAGRPGRHLRGHLALSALRLVSRGNE